MSKDNQQIDNLISNLQKLKSMEGRGAGFKEIWSSIKSGFDWVRKNKPISTTLKKVRNNPIYKGIVSNVPGLKNIDNFAGDVQTITEIAGVGGIINEKKGRGRPKKKPQV